MYQSINSLSSSLSIPIFQHLPLGAHLEEVILCLLPARAPPALSGGSALRPVQVLPGEVATCLRPLIPRGEPLGATRNRPTWLLPARHLELLPGSPASGPLAGFRPLLLGNLSIEVPEGSGEPHRPRFRPVRAP